jgi:hypothetical protein
VLWLIGCLFVECGARYEARRRRWLQAVDASLVLPATVEETACEEDCGSTKKAQWYTKTEFDLLLPREASNGSRRGI